MQSDRSARERTPSMPDLEEDAFEADDDDLEASRYTFFANRVSSLKYLNSHSVDIIHDRRRNTSTRAELGANIIQSPMPVSFTRFRRTHAPVQRMVPAAHVGIGVVEEGSTVAVDVGLPETYWAGNIGRGFVAGRGAG